MLSVIADAVAEFIPKISDSISEIRMVIPEPLRIHEKTEKNIIIAQTLKIFLPPDNTEFTSISELNVILLMIFGFFFLFFLSISIINKSAEKFTDIVETSIIIPAELPLKISDTQPKKNDEPAPEADGYI